MEVFFWAVFGALVVLCAGLEGSKGQRDKLQTSPAFESFKNNYLLVYSLMMAGDWLQGPYVYALYQHYGYDKGDIGRLFIAGFGSSMVFGTIVGSLADKHGRRRASLTYCGVYVLSCLTKHSPDYRLLMLGRVLGGIATSLLFSAFESWLVAEHFKRGFEAQWLSVTFSSAIWLGNGLIAILSGLLANSLVTSLALGPVAPFDAAALVLLLGGAIITATWPENYGDSTDSKGLLAQFHAAASAIASGGLPSPQVGCHRLRWAAIASGGLPSPQVGCHRLRWAAIASGGLPSPQVGCHRLRWAAIASGGLPSPQVGCHRLRWAAIASGGLPSPQVGCHRLRWAAIASAPRGADEINALSERTSALRINDLPVEGGVNGAEVNKPVANTSDKGNAKIQDLEDDGGYLSDDPDECQDPVVLNEIAAQAGVAITLLVPFAWSKEIPCIIVTVNHLLSLWGKHMSGNVCKTTRCQKLTPTFLSKQHFGRVEVVFLQEADAVFMRSREIEHYTTNDKKLVLGWQYPENKEYLRERAAHPEAIEVLLKGVPAVISPAMIMKNLVTAMLVKQGRTAFLDGSAFHRVLDPASGSDTDKIKGLVFRHPGDKRSQQRASTLTSVSSSPRAAASLKITPAVKTLLADPAMAFTSTGGVWEEWVCAQEECGKAHGTSFETAVEHVQTIHHGTGLLKAGAATRVSMGKQNVAQVWKEFGLQAAGGVAIMSCRRNIRFTEVTPDPSGRVLGVTVEGGEEPFRLVAAYLPAQACNRAKFYREQLEPFIQLQPQSSHLVVVGDLNMIADPDLDKSPGAGSGRENQRFIEMWQGHDLGDAIRVLHPTDKERKKKGVRKTIKGVVDSLDKAGREPLERLLSRLAAALRAHDKEERKRVTATQLHLTEEVERMRHLVMGGPTDDQTLARLLTKEEQLEAYRENEREVFAGLTTELQGEIPSPYLSAKVKMRKERTLIEEVVFNGERHRGSQAVLKAASLYFEEAFREVQMEPQLACTDFAVDRVLPAAAEAVVRLGAPWAEPEVKAALKGLPRGKSPGQDELPAELFVSHWDLLGGCFMEFVRNFEKTGLLQESLTTAVTVLLHKKGDKDRLTNYRPILLTTVYKVLAKVMANRIKKELHHVISKEQHGFVPGRSLADAVSVVADAIEAADNDGEDWYLLLVDFQKAYDTVSRPFLFRTLEKLGLPANFIKWAEGLHRGSGTRIAINGWRGEKVEMERVVRQGCPLAPYLFLCALEPLCAEIARRGLGVGTDGASPISYVGYADDTSLILRGADQIRSAAAALEWFGELSGLRINQDKSIIMPMGRNKGKTSLPGVTYKWAEDGVPERLLGVWITPDGDAAPSWEKAWERGRKELIKPGDCGENFRSVEWGTGPTAEEGRRLIDPKARLDSMAIRTVGKYLTEQDATKRWLTEKAAAMAQGVATLFAHKSAGNHWEKGNQRWKAIAEIFRESPFAELPAPTNGWEVEWELLSFNRRIMFRGGSPFGNRKGAAGILKSRLGDLLQTKEDGSRPKRMGADQRGWEQTKEDGSRPKRMGADQRGWEQTKEDGSRPKRMGADQRGWEQTKEDGSRPKRMGADQRGWEQTKEDGSRPKRMGADQRGWEQRSQRHRGTKDTFR
ncbi:unnamed protein product [Closterium sp. NIES-65]|nr:unnamed protein product [Closterium sp. NIES-65]